MKKFVAIALVAFGLLVTVPQPAQANPISDAASGLGHVVVQAGGDVVDAGKAGVGIIVDGVMWTVDQVLAICDKFAYCEDLHHLAARILKAMAKWMSDHPTEAVLIQVGLLVLVPIAGEAIMVESTAAFGGIDLLDLGTEEALVGYAGEEVAVEATATSLVSDEAIQTGVKKTLVKAAEKAAANGEETFSLCSESNCVLDAGTKAARASQSEIESHTTEILERQGMKSATGEELDLTSSNPRMWHIDHKLPLACGGTNDISNLQILTAAENLAKGSFVDCTEIPVSLLLGV